MVTKKKCLSFFLKMVLKITRVTDFLHEDEVYNYCNQRPVLAVCHTPVN